MYGVAGIDWGSVFVPDLSLAESFLHGSAVYLSLVVLFRLTMQRQAGAIGLPDVMLVVLVSECVSAALGGDAKSVPNGLVTVFALVFWNAVLDRAAYRRPWLRRLLEPEPRLLVKDGRPLHEHLKRERISDDELAAQLRCNGVAEVSGVKVAYLEPEGTVSVVPADPPSVTPPVADPPAPEPARVPDDRPDFDTLTARFLVAATDLQRAVAWHEQRADRHKSAARAARQLLNRHGVRPNRVLEPAAGPEPRLRFAPASDPDTPHPRATGAPK